jgi:hypothetical protein
MNTSSHHSLVADNSQVENGSYLTLLNLDKGSTDQVFNSSYCQSECTTDNGKDI